MLSFISGKIIEKSQQWAIVVTHGIGYKVFCNTAKIASGEEVALFTYHHIREDQQALYGFTTSEELRLFELLITVNGVGPKVGMAIMTSAKPEQIISAIASGDSALFKAVSGIGQKVAAKIIVELKTKVGGMGEVDLSSLEGGNDVVDALEVLGYRKDEIREVMRQIPAEFEETQEKISWALKQMGKNNH